MINKVKYEIKEVAAGVFRINGCRLPMNLEEANVVQQWLQAARLSDLISGPTTFEHALERASIEISRLQRRVEELNDSLD